MVDLLIVDDDTESCSEIRSMIENSAYSYLSILECATAERALHVVKQEQPNLVVFDISLPDMNGVDFGRRVLQSRPLTFVVVHTQLKMFETIYDAINVGFSGYLLKPAAKSDLVSLMDRLYQIDLVTDRNAVRRGISSPEGFRPDLGRPIESVLAYLNEHYQDPLTLHEVADRVYLSPSYFSRLFKAEIGTTFTEFLTQLRIKKSKTLLRMTSLSMEIVANNTGFANASYFATTFKRIEGRTPSEYRNLFSNFSAKQSR